MTVKVRNLQVDAKTAELLEARAAARGLSVAELLADLAAADEALPPALEAMRNAGTGPWALPSKGQWTNDAHGVKSDPVNVYAFGPFDALQKALLKGGWTRAMDNKFANNAKYIGSADAENAYLKVDNSNVAVNSGADTSGYTSMQKQAIALTQKAKSISQYMDRDTRPDFAQTVMISAIQSFIDKHSPSDIDALCTNIEAQKKSIFATPVS